MLYFGTASNGGHFYAVEAKSGEVMFEFKTSGTENFVWVEGQILLANCKNKPALISAKNGLLLKKIEFEFWFSYRSDHTNKRWQALRYGK